MFSAYVIAAPLVEVNPSENNYLNITNYINMTNNSLLWNGHAYSSKVSQWDNDAGYVTQSFFNDLNWTQFSNTGGTLNILESYLYSLFYPKSYMTNYYNKSETLNTTEIYGILVNKVRIMGSDLSMNDGYLNRTYHTSLTNANIDGFQWYNTTDYISNGTDIKFLNNVWNDQEIILS
jgi:hypothetical protein